MIHSIYSHPAWWPVCTVFIIDSMTPCFHSNCLPSPFSARQVGSKPVFFSFCSLMQKLIIQSEIWVLRKREKIKRFLSPFDGKHVYSKSISLSISVLLRYSTTCVHRNILNIYKTKERRGSPDIFFYLKSTFKLIMIRTFILFLVASLCFTGMTYAAPGKIIFFKKKLLDTNQNWFYSQY